MPAAQMENYLSGIDFAVSSTIEILNKDMPERDRLRKKGVEKISSAIQDAQNISQIFENSESAEDDSYATGRYWNSLFDAAEGHKLFTESEKIQEVIDSRKFSIEVISASILQYAKQGLSVVHKSGARKLKRGRMIGTQTLSQVVWAARNQSQHYEEGDLHEDTIQVFEALKSDGYLSGLDFRNTNCAYEIIKILNWDDKAVFKSDMASLG